jgi:alpha,alpha-trehalose phosphorylase
VTYRGQLLEIQIGLDTVEYTLRDGERVVIRRETEELELTREHPLTVRPVSRS